MSIDISEMIDLLVSEVKNATAGALTEDVLVQFICQTGEDEHDPDAEPDDRVRPSHAAFHGRIFNLSEAPVPPLDYGCRCAIRYVAAPDSPAATILDITADEEVTTPAVATKEWLKKNVVGLAELTTIAKKAAPKDAIIDVQERAKELGNDDPKIIAEMVVDSLAEI